MDHRLELLGAEDVLRLARADAARNSLLIESVDLCQAIQNAIGPFSHTISQKELKIDLQLPPESISVKADSKRIARVLRNLTDNAVRYTPAKGEVKICISSERPTRARPR